MALSKKRLKEISRESMIEILNDESQEMQEQLDMLLWHSIEEAYRLGRKSVRNSRGFGGSK